MKKRFMLVVVLLMLSVMILTPVAQAATLLKMGSVGSQVLTLQTQLKSIGLNPGPLDGIYGSKTKAAVQAFQRNSNLQADGIYGPLTEKALTQALTTSSTDSATASNIVATAKRYIGVPYLWGGNTPTGFDCSGFTKYVFAQNGITLPRVSRDQYTVGSFVEFNALKPGDLVFFSFLKDGIVSHVGIYIGENQFISATTSKGVIISSFSPYWKDVYVGAKRIK